MSWFFSFIHTAVTRFEGISVRRTVTANMLRASDRLAVGSVVFWQDPDSSVNVVVSILYPGTPALTADSQLTQTSNYEATILSNSVPRDPTITNMCTNTLLGTAFPVSSSCILIPE
jgi:hypothetical protein